VCVCARSLVSSRPDRFRSRSPACGFVSTSWFCMCARACLKMCVIVKRCECTASCALSCALRNHVDAHWIISLKSELQSRSKSFYPPRTGFTKKEKRGNSKEKFWQAWKCCFCKYPHFDVSAFPLLLYTTRSPRGWRGDASGGSGRGNGSCIENAWLNAAFTCV